MQSKSHPIDQYVGARLRLRRRALNISQTDLALRLGLTFQQIQKYERGANRISASKLYALARLLRVEPGWFFDGLPPTDSGQGCDVIETQARRAVQALISTPEGFALAQFLSVMPRDRRRRVLALMSALVDLSPDQDAA